MSICAFFGICRFIQYTSFKFLSSRCKWNICFTQFGHSSHFLNLTNFLMWVHLCGNIIFHLHRVLQTVCVGNLAGRLLKTLQDKKKLGWNRTWNCWMSPWSCPVGSKYVPGWNIWLCQLYTSKEDASRRCPILLGRYCVSPLEVGIENWPGRDKNKETCTISNACKAHKWSCQVYLFDSVDNNYSDFDSGVGVDSGGYFCISLLLLHTVYPWALVQPGLNFSCILLNLHSYCTVTGQHLAHGTEDYSWYN